jgi:hypothetical protein
MKAVEQFAKLGPVGVLKPRCTTRSERTYRCRRTRRFGVMCAAQGAWVSCRSWAAYTIVSAVMTAHFAGGRLAA